MAGASILARATQSSRAREAADPGTHPRAMFTVALIGPDGAGKTTLGRHLERDLGLPVKYLYMGVNAEASNSVLPTTRLVRALKRARGAPPDNAGPPDPLAPALRPRGLTRRIRVAAKGLLRLVNQLAEEWHRQLLASRHVRRGAVVVFDRHFYADFHAYDIAGGAHRSYDRRVHGFLLARLYPQPDLVIYLDAPPEVLLARKGEGTLEALARRRGDYLALRELSRNFAVVDAARPIDEVALDVTDLVRSFATTRSLAPLSASG